MLGFQDISFFRHVHDRRAILRSKADDCSAILDRIVHNAHRIVIQGDSMRKQKAAPLLTSATVGSANAS
ncbi:ATP-binding protein [Mesorhizobium sp.]|uniref:ATP-binding protein n=1 Tax=Mesorhizobium sp. TaxID=1871066 RepID=UPI0025FA5101|nr:ATP-binding protein [Mesorhizobium sp.]